MTAPVSPIEWQVMAAVSAVLVVLTATGLWPMSWVEVAGFATAATCVWLMARGHRWTWPFGIVSNLAYGALFFEARLYADMALQGLFIALSVYGWRVWAGSGTAQPPPVRRASRDEWLALLILVPAATVAIREILLRVNGAAPLLDALTTSLSLAAQYLASRRRLENWLLWIAADLIYIPLYFSRSLPLTAFLYVGFLVMCVIGWRQWRQEQVS
ncbi:nicotinamide riboside transporter PnuC [Nevskia sp.]|uniref:nicotinamide riboside transporter PnuC n=1 Tax=Nevskia sp. TaxID=1929292 RepID=UPI0025DE2289|nr:nicotinamide riboside transporter PnuC [Nevskia sp.]